MKHPLPAVGDMLYHELAPSDFVMRTGVVSSIIPAGKHRDGRDRRRFVSHGPKIGIEDDTRSWGTADATIWEQWGFAQGWYPTREAAVNGSLDNARKTINNIEREIVALQNRIAEIHGFMSSIEKER